MGDEEPGDGGWIRMLRADHTEGTITKYSMWGRRFQEWIGAAGEKPRPGTLERWEAVLRDGSRLDTLVKEASRGTAWETMRPPEDGYAYRTRVQAVSAAKSFLDYVHGVRFDGRQAHNVANIVRGEEPAFDPTIATPGQVQEVLDDTARCERESCHAMARVGYDAIMRLSEITSVRRGDIDLGRGTIYVRAIKGSKNRHIRLADRTLEVLRDHLELLDERADDPEWAFYSEIDTHGAASPWSTAGGSGWSRHFSSEHWGPGFHSFARHSAITNRLNAGESITQVYQRARHSSPSMTQRYMQFVADSGVTVPELE